MYTTCCNNDLEVCKVENIKASIELWHQKETADVLVRFLAIVWSPT